MSKYECSMANFLTLSRTVPAAIVGAACAFGAASAQDSASQWSPALKSAARLIAAPSRDGAAYRAGIEIKLAPATITYWRSPGEAGVPPVVDFSKSTNLAHADLSFPAPRRIQEEGGGDVFGYAGSVVLPVRVVARDPGQPVALVADLDYAACEKICLPVHARLQLTLPVTATADEPALASAEANVPRGLSAEAVARDVAIAPMAGADKPTWRLHWGGSAPVQDLFAEAPDLFYVETRRAGDDFLLVLADHPKDTALPERPVIITMTGPTPPVEFAVHLDAKAATP